MKTTGFIPLLLAGAALLAGCNDSSNRSTAEVRVIHAASDAPLVNVRVDGETAKSDVDFKQVATLSARTGSHTIAVDAQLPDGTAQTVIGPASVALERGTHYDVIALGKVGDSTLAPLILEDDGLRDSETSVRLRVAHLSPDAEEAAGGAVSVFVTDPAADLASQSPTITFSFGEDAGPIEVPSGDYRIRITPASDTTNVVYDSGTVPLSSGADLLIGAIDNTRYGDSPVSLLVVNGDDATEILSAGSGAGLRAAHNSAPPTPNVDIYLNKDPDGSPDVTNLAYGQTVPTAAPTGAYVALAAGDNRVVVTANADLTPVVDETLALADGDAKTLVVAGLSGDLSPLVFSDDNRRIATEAKLRVIHGAIEAPTVDVFLVPTDAGGAGATMIGNASPALDDFTYESSSGYLGVPEGDYVIFITSADGATEYYKSPSLTLDAGGIYTAIARANSGGSTFATVTLMDDFAPD